MIRKDHSAKIAMLIQALLFGIWHIVTPLHNLIDGDLKQLQIYRITLTAKHKRRDRLMSRRSSFHRSRSCFRVGCSLPFSSPREPARPLLLNPLDFPFVPGVGQLVHVGQGIQPFCLLPCQDQISEEALALALRDPVRSPPLLDRIILPPRSAAGAGKGKSSPDGTDSR